MSVIPSRAILAAFVSTLLVTASCQPSREEQIVQAWLHCIDCLDGQLDSVAALGSGAIPRLRDAVRDGPSNERRARIRQQATSIHASLGAAAPSPLAEYVDLIEANYVAGYQQRAVRAIVRIGGQQAITALKAVAQGDTGSFSPHVRDALRAAIASLEPAQQFQGVLSTSTPAFGDTVYVGRPATGPFSMVDVAVLEDAFYDPGDVLISRTADTIAFVVTAPPGLRVLTIRDPSPPAPPGSGASVAVTVRSFADPNDRLHAQCTDLPCRVASAPYLLDGPAAEWLGFLSLRRWPTLSDTMAVFRIRSIDPRAATAELDWRPDSNLDLRWIDCTTMAPVGNLDGATSALPERTSVMLPGGSCFALLVMLAEPGPTTVVARLQLTSP